MTIYLYSLSGVVLRLLTYIAEGRTPKPAASSELEVEFHSDPDGGNDALGIEELEREVSRTRQLGGRTTSGSLAATGTTQIRTERPSV